MANTLFPHPKHLAYTLLVSILSLVMCNADVISNNITGFSIDIFHRDSPLSPTYNSSLSPDQHLYNAVQRSIERVRLINSRISTQSPYSFILLTKGVYMTSFNLGTPSVPILSLVDTGSNFIWTQCKGCTKCFPQASPYFDPKKSSTYNLVRCGSLTCRSLYGTYCDPQRIFCEYGIQYEDHSQSLGSVASDTITFRTTDRRLQSFPSVEIGCAYDTSGVFKGEESGVLGIGSGYGSLIRQLDSAIKGRFSYCLVSIRASKRSSKLNFGDNAIVSGPGTLSTRLFLQNGEYHVQLDAVSINHIRLEYTDMVNNSEAWAGTGNMLIDCGTTVTFLNKKFYVTLVITLKNYLRLGVVADPERQLDTCFEAQPGAISIVFTFHFRGANVDVRAENLFIRRNLNVICFAVRATDGESLLGNMAQQNFLVGYDLRLSRVSFKRFDCEKYR